MCIHVYEIWIWVAGGTVDRPTNELGIGKPDLEAVMLNSPCEHTSVIELEKGNSYPRTW